MQNRFCFKTLNSHYVCFHIHIHIFDLWFSTRVFQYSSMCRERNKIAPISPMFLSLLEPLARYQSTGTLGYGVPGVLPGLFQLRTHTMLYLPRTQERSWKCYGNAGELYVPLWSLHPSPLPFQNCMNWAALLLGLITTLTDI